MDKFIIFITILIICNPLIANAEKFVVIIPTKQIRRSPSLPARMPTNARVPIYGKSAPYNFYGSVRHAVNQPANNPVLYGPKDYEHSQEGTNHIVRPYGNNINYVTYARGYAPYDKLKGGPVPLVHQNRYATESSRFRQPIGPDSIYGTAPVVSGYHQTIDGNSYHINNNLLGRVQQSVDQPQAIFTGTQHIGNDDPSIAQRSSQTIALSAYPKVEPIVVKDPGNRHEISQTGDFYKESSNGIGKIPSTSTIGFDKDGIVFRDSLLLDDYEKKIAEFTKKWPRLSAFPGSFGSSLSSGVQRISDNFHSSNSIGRQGYEVKEEIDEPPIDFRTMPIIASPLQAYTTPISTSEFGPAFG